MRVVFLTHNYPRLHRRPVGRLPRHPRGGPGAPRGSTSGWSRRVTRGRGGEDQIDGVPVRRVRYAVGDGRDPRLSRHHAAALRGPRGLGALAGLWRALRRARPRGDRRRRRPGPCPLVGARRPGAPEDRPQRAHGARHRCGAAPPRAGWRARWPVRSSSGPRVVTAVSRELAGWVQAGTGRYVEPAHIHPMPVDTEQPALDRRAGAARSSLARLTSQKRVDLAIETVAALAACGHELPLTIVGDGPERRLWSSWSAGSASRRSCASPAQCRRADVPASPRRRRRHALPGPGGGIRPGRGGGADGRRAGGRLLGRRRRAGHRPRDRGGAARRSRRPRRSPTRCWNSQRPRPAGRGRAWSASRGGPGSRPTTWPSCARDGIARRWVGRSLASGGAVVVGLAIIVFALPIAGAELGSEFAPQPLDWQLEPGVAPAERGPGLGDVRAPRSRRGGRCWRVGPAARRWSAARIWTVSSLGKYLPGKVWAVAGMALMAQRARRRPWAATGSAVMLQALAIGTGAAVAGVCRRGRPGGRRTRSIVGAPGARWSARARRGPRCSSGRPWWAAAADRGAGGGGADRAGGPGDRLRRRGQRGSLDRIRRGVLAAWPGVCCRRPGSASPRRSRCSRPRTWRGSSRSSRPEGWGSAKGCSF